MEEISASILIVEDHLPTRRFLAENLTVDGYRVLEAGTVEQALARLDADYPDLALLDLGLPGRDGLDLLRRIRGSDRIADRIDPDLPVLVLTGRTSELDRLRAFDRGADDHLGKPFSYPELNARIAALLRRSARRGGGGRIRVGPLEIDVLARQVWVGSERVALSKKEFALLRALAADPTRVFTREELLRGVWGFRQMGATRTLDSHACRLRQKLRAAGGGFVVNVWGVGYRLIDGALD